MFSRHGSGFAWIFSFIMVLVVCEISYAQNTGNPAQNQSIVCKIDGQSITEQELLSEIEQMVKMAGNRVRPETIPQMKVFLYSRALNNLEEKILLKNVATKKKIVVDQADIDTRFKQVRDQFPTEDQFKQVLAANSLTPESLKEKMKEELLYGKVLESEVKEAPAPTDEEIQKFFDENKDQMKQEEQVTASHILIKVDSKATADDKAKAKQKLEGIRKDIVDKKVTFADAAKQNSDCPSKAKGGDLGSFGRGQMVPEFDQAAFALKVGELSNIVETQFGYHIIQVNDHKEAKDATLADMKDKIKEYLQGDKTQKARQDYVQKLKDASKIETVMDENAWKAKYTPKQPAAQEGDALQLSPDDLKP